MHREKLPAWSLWRVAIRSAPASLSSECFIVLVPDLLRLLTTATLLGNITHCSSLVLQTKISQIFWITTNFTLNFIVVNEVGRAQFMPSGLNHKFFATRSVGWALLMIYFEKFMWLNGFCLNRWHIPSQSRVYCASEMINNDNFCLEYYYRAMHIVQKNV